MQCIMSRHAVSCSLLDLLVLMPFWLEQEAEGISSILQLEELEQEGKDDDEHPQPEVDTDALLGRVGLCRYEDSQGDDAECKQAV